MKTSSTKGSAPGPAIISKSSSPSSSQRPRTSESTTPKEQEHVQNNNQPETPQPIPPAPVDVGPVQEWRLWVPPRAASPISVTHNDDAEVPTWRYWAQHTPTVTSDPPASPAAVKSDGTPVAVASPAPKGGPKIAARTQNSSPAQSKGSASNAIWVPPRASSPITVTHNDDAEVPTWRDWAPPTPTVSSDPPTSPQTAPALRPPVTTADVKSNGNAPVSVASPPPKGGPKIAARTQNPSPAKSKGSAPKAPKVVKGNEKVTRQQAQKAQQEAKEGKPLPDGEVHKAADKIEPAEPLPEAPGKKLKGAGTNNKGAQETGEQINKKKQATTTRKPDDIAVEKRNAEAKKLEEEGKRKDAEVKKKMAQLKKREEELKQESEKAEKRKKEISDLETALLKREAEVQRHEEKVQTMQHEADLKAAMLAGQESGVKQKEKELNQKEIALRKREEKVQQQSEKIQQMRQEAQKLFQDVKEQKRVLAMTCSCAVQQSESELNFRFPEHVQDGQDQKDNDHRDLWRAPSIVSTKSLAISLTDAESYYQQQWQRHQQSLAMVVEQYHFSTEGGFPGPKETSKDQPLDPEVSMERRAAKDTGSTVDNGLTGDAHDKSLSRKDIEKLRTMIQKLK